MQNEDKSIIAKASFWVALLSPVLTVLLINLAVERLVRSYTIRDVGFNVLMLINMTFLYWMEFMALCMAYYTREHLIARVAIIIAVTGLLVATVAVLLTKNMLA